MPCKRSFFSPTLFKKNLTRFWPLWGLLSLGGALFPLWLLLGLMANRGVIQNEHMAEDFAEILYTAAAYAAPYIAFICAILCAMLVWGYLMNGRAVGLMHTLPVDRTCLFITGAASGLAMMLIPYVVTGSLVCLIALCWGFLDIKAVGLTALAVILLTVAYFGIATFCAMITGNVFMAGGLYLLLNFLAPLVTNLFNSLYTNFFLGLTSSEYTISLWLSPPIKIAQNFEVTREYVGETYSYEGRVMVLHGWGTLALYAGVGLALLGLGWLLYRLRHSESAGDVMVFPWLRPVFRYGGAILSALTVGRLFYVMLWEATFQRGSWYDPAPMGLCLAAGGLLGYYIASMLLERSLRVFKGSLPGVAAVCAGALVLTLWLAFDPFGLQTRVPDPADVERVQLGSSVSMDLRAGEDDAYIRDVVDLHQAIVDDMDYFKTQENSYLGYGTPYDEEGQVRRTFALLDLDYTLKNGAHLRRTYRVYVTADRAADPDTFDGKLEALVSGERALWEETVGIPEGRRLEQIHLYDRRAGTETDLPRERYQAILDALERDLEAGHIPTPSLFSDGTRQMESYSLSLDMNFTDQEGNYTDFRSVMIYPTMTETIRYLLDQGPLTEETLADLRLNFLINSTTAAKDHGIGNLGALSDEELAALMDEYAPGWRLD